MGGVPSGTRLCKSTADQGTGVGLSAKIVAVDALVADEKAQWIEWQAGNPLTQSPFFRYEFALAVARHAPDCHVAKLYDGEKLIGFFPFQKRGGTLYPLGAPMNDYHGVVGPQGTAPDLESIAQALKAKRLAVNSWVGEARSGREETSCQVVLSDGYDEWLSERLKSHGKYFKDKARSRRSMQTQLGDIELKVGLKSPQLLDRLIGLKREQFKRTGRHDIFGVKWTRALLHDLMENDASADFGASIATLSAGGELLAVEYSLHAGCHYHFWFPVYLETGARFSPGILLSMDTMQALEPQGFRVFDYGFGGDSYKKYFVNSYQPVREAVVTGTGQGPWWAVAGNRLLEAGMRGRAEPLRLSVQRRWSVIEASEVSLGGKIKGAVLAAGRASTRIIAGDS